MVAAQREQTAARPRPKREFPNEWTLYPDWDEEGERQEQQTGQRQSPANTSNEDPIALAKNTAGRRRAP
jgi:hypothetical protein